MEVSGSVIIQLTSSTETNQYRFLLFFSVILVEILSLKWKETNRNWGFFGELQAAKRVNVTRIQFYTQKFRSCVTIRRSQAKIFHYCRVLTRFSVFDRSKIRSKSQHQAFPLKTQHCLWRFYSKTRANISSDKHVNLIPVMKTRTRRILLETTTDTFLCDRSKFIRMKNSRRKKNSEWLSFIELE